MRYPALFAGMLTIGCGVLFPQLSKCKCSAIAVSCSIHLTCALIEQMACRVLIGLVGNGAGALGEPSETTLPEPELETAVITYLAEHPDAMDTMEGIAEWWVMRQRIRVQLEALSRVLSRLTHDGLLEKIGQGEKARYRLKMKSED
jgi:hypothetical protein